VTEYFLGRYTKDQFNSEAAALKTAVEQAKLSRFANDEKLFQDEDDDFLTTELLHLK
jgi:hypothetical protein